MDVIVLMKYVADVEHIQADAWDLDTGTLRRGRLRMGANPLDDRALSAAVRTARGTGGRVVAISMGPRAAEALLRRAIAFGADKTVLLSDAAFAGADTLATSRVLARAVERSVAEYDLDRPLILAGMQSPDGDTAQVPAELAGLLKLPIVPYVTGLTVRDGEVQLELLRRRRRVLVTLLETPAVVTMTALATSPGFATSLSRLETASTAAVDRWSADDLGLEQSQVGLAGSATRVISIDTVEHGRAGASAIDLDDEDDPKAAVEGAIGDLLSRLAAPHDDAAGPANPADDSAEQSSEQYGHEIWVFLDTTDDEARRGSLELLGEARRLAASTGSLVAAVACAEGPDAANGAELASCGADAVLVLRGSTTSVAADPMLHHLHANLLAEAAQARRPRTILVPATLHGRLVAPLTAARLGAGLTADCTDLEVNEDGSLLQIRPALGGNILASIVSTARERAPEMATVRAGVFPLRRDIRTAAAFETLVLDVAHPHHDTVETIGHAESGPAAQPRAGVDPDADVVIAVGMGIGSRENIDKYVEPLREAFARRMGLTTTLACSRAAVEAGILPYEYQVGQTGKSVRPTLYVAIGISGAIQHRLGMENSAQIVSVNPDRDAPIHAIADVAIVASIADAAPLVLAAI